LHLWGEKPGRYQPGNATETEKATAIYLEGSHAYAVGIGIEVVLEGGWSDDDENKNKQEL
jgi:hypothetical protein